MTIRRASLIALALAATAFPVPADAQDFYKGRTLNIVVGFTAGGGFDINARLLARYIGRHIPGNPDVVVQNMPGAASIKSVLYLDTTAPKDGTVIATFNFGQIGDSRMRPEKVKVDFTRFNWIGSISQDLTVCYAWHKVGVKSLAELKAHGLIHMGLTGVGTSSDLNQKILKDISGHQPAAGRRLSRQRRGAAGDRAR